MLQTTITMRLKHVFILITFFMLCGMVRSQTDTETQSLLWKISGNGIEKPSYLFGTIHIIPKENYYFPQQAEKILEQCDMLLLEVDMDISLEEKLAMAQKMTLPQGKTLQEYMTKEEFDRFSSYMLDSIGIRKGKFKRYIRLKPFFLSGVLITELIKDFEMYEDKLSKMASRAKIPVKGLETIDYQMSLLDSFPISQQVAMLTDTTASYSNIKTEYQTLLDAYLTKDLNKLYEKIANEIPTKDFEDVFIIKRNQNWVEQIEELTKNKVLFVAVGAGHIGSPNGLIQLLRNKGYELTPVQL